MFILVSLSGQVSWSVWLVGWSGGSVLDTCVCDIHQKISDPYLVRSELPICLKFVSYHLFTFKRVCGFLNFPLRMWSLLSLGVKLNCFRFVSL